jgi:hypothetical protein
MMIQPSKHRRGEDQKDTLDRIADVRTNKNNTGTAQRCIHEL